MRTIQSFVAETTSQEKPNGPNRAREFPPRRIELEIEGGLTHECL